MSFYTFLSRPPDENHPRDTYRLIIPQTLLYVANRKPINVTNDKQINIHTYIHLGLAIPGRKWTSPIFEISIQQCNRHEATRQDFFIVPPPAKSIGVYIPKGCIFKAFFHVFMSFSSVFPPFDSPPPKSYFLFYLFPQRLFCIIYFPAHMYNDEKRHTDDTHCWLNAWLVNDVAWAGWPACW